jgi:hypothetical protein
VLQVIEIDGWLTLGPAAHPPETPAIAYHDTRSGQEKQRIARAAAVLRARRKTAAPECPAFKFS